MSTIDLRVREPAQPRAGIPGAERAPVCMTPGLAPADADCAYWMAQVTLRLRREICWCWHQRAGQRDSGHGVPPPYTDPAQDSLDLARHRHDKQRFFEEDVTARYLTEQLSASAPPPGTVPGLWRRAAEEARLDAAAQFVLALFLAARLDASLGPVFASCHNDANRQFPTLALAQRLWDDPLAIVACAETSHPLFRFALLSPALDAAHAGHWQQPFEVAGPVARVLSDPEVPLPSVLQPVTPAPIGGRDDAQGWPVLGASDELEHMQVVPLIGLRGTDFARVAAALTLRIRNGGDARTLVKVADDAVPERGAVTTLAALAWLLRADVVLPEHWSDVFEHKADPWFVPVLSVPVRWFVPGSTPACCKPVPSFALAPAVLIGGLDFARRMECFAAGLGRHAESLRPAIAEAAKRYRCQEKTIATITASLNRPGAVPSGEDLLDACRAAVTNELDHLAQAVKPRFQLSELVLPKTQGMQLGETVRAMRALATVHYGWGTARAWNESGLSLLFCGPPGTGKTMAAEALASELGMPMYRVDLSQVVNKYVGETEKNLKRIFDAVEVSDCLLFFDEADALFGKRTEVKDAHDRFANIEISYLLERMERFKGLAVLATNRRKDLDEAFTRRLRYIIEFPLPGTPERERIWRQVFPADVDTRDLDFGFLARTFQLAGGHIRSIAFNACLQAAASGPEPRVGMREVLIAIKRELDKMNRPSGRELFEPHGDLLAGVFA